MNMTPSLKKQSDKPQILLSCVRDKTGKITHYRTIDFQPGAVIERCGKRYQLQADGSQRRI